MTTEEAKLTLLSLTSMLGLTALKDGNPSTAEYFKKVHEATKLACDALDLAKDRDLEIEKGDN